MGVDNQEQTQQFLEAVTDGDFEQAVDAFESDYKQEFAESVPTLAQGETTLSPVKALERMVLILTRQYGTLEGAAEITIENDTKNRVAATLRFATTTQSIQVQFTEDGQIVQFDLQQAYSPPDYSDKAAFSERDVTMSVENGELDGTITVPDSDGAVPAVVLVKGTGQTDRDYTRGANKPYRDIAWGLATQGIAVIRYEERTMVPRDDEALGLETIVQDAVTAIDRVRDVPTVAPDRIFVGGWSFGGIPIPRIVVEDGNAAGGILLDSPTPAEIWDNRGDHRRALLDADWLTDAERDRVEAQAQEFDKAGEADSGGADQVDGVPVDVLDEFMSYDHGQALQNLSVPVFVLGTGRQRDTAFKTGFNRWKETLSERKTAFVWCPDLNHSFQYGEGTATGLEMQLLHDNVDSRVVEEVQAWIHAVPSPEE